METTNDDNGSLAVLWESEDPLEVPLAAAIPLTMTRYSHYKAIYDTLRLV
jgi:hypothetical protein